MGAVGQLDQGVAFVSLTAQQPLSRLRFAPSLRPQSMVQFGSSCVQLVLLLLLLELPADAQNLVHHWSFDTDGVVEDGGSGAARNGTLVGGATVSAGVLRLNGVTGHVQFDGNLVPTSPTYTVSLNARSSGGSTAGAFADFISQGSPGAAFYIGVGEDGTSIRAGDNWTEVVGAAFIADGGFHHYTLTMTSTEATFYVDGELVATMAPFAGGAGGTPTRLGRGPGDSRAYFNGELDDVRIYDGALSAAAVREAMHTPRSFSPQKPLAPTPSPLPSPNDNDVPR